MFKKIRNSEIFKDGKFGQVLILSVSFMLIFTAFTTTCIIEQTVLASVKIDDPSFTGSGYVSLAIIYAVFAIVTWIAPSIVAVLKAKKCLFLSALFYLFFIASFLLPSAWLLYVTSALIGGSAAVLWTAQGNFLSMCSTPETISRNSGIFWAINQSNMFFGNLFVYWQFHGKSHIDSGTRTVVFSVLTGVCVLGILCFLFLKNLSSEDDDKSQEDKEVESIGKRNNRRNPSSHLVTAWNAFKESLKLSITPHMLLLSVASLYTGFQQSFYSGIYSTSIGSTEAFEDPKKLVGLIGILIGCGEVVGGLLFGLLGKITTKKGSTPIVALGLLTHTVCYTLIYLNLPNDAPLGSTSDVSFFAPPRISIAIICAFLLGFGDACWITQLMSMFASGYADKSAAAFAIFKFIQSAGSAATFFFSLSFGLYIQLLILVIFGILGAICFAIVEWRMKLSKLKKGVSSVDDVNSTDSVESSNKIEANPVMAKDDESVEDNGRFTFVVNEKQDKQS